MAPFGPDTHFPRASAPESARALVSIYGRRLDDIRELPLDLKVAEFHPLGKERVSEQGLLGWRNELNDWAANEGFPSEMDSNRRSEWDVLLGQRLIEDLRDAPEFLHPDVWCWIATFLLPHFVLYRWGWPKPIEGEPPKAVKTWARFGADARNGLRIAVNRILLYGPEISLKASEQEFQSIQNRPAFGADPRVAKVVMSAFMQALDDPDSNYGKNYGDVPGDRSRDNNLACMELRLINSLRPLCFESDETINEITLDVVKRLPDLRAVAAK